MAQNAGTPTGPENVGQQVDDFNGAYSPFKFGGAYSPFKMGALAVPTAEPAPRLTLAYSACAAGEAPVLEAGSPKPTPRRSSRLTSGKKAAQRSRRSVSVKNVVEPVVEAVVNKKRQLAGYIAPSYNAQPYQDFVRSPDAAKRRRTTDAAKAQPRLTAPSATFSTLNEVAGRLREQAGAASEHIAAAGTAAAAAAVAAKQRLGSAASNAVKIVDDEVDAIVDPVAQARQATHGAPPASHGVFRSERALPFRVFTESFARSCRRSRRVRWWRRRSI